METFLKNLKDDNLTHPSVFDLYRSLQKQDNEIQNICYDYADDFKKWAIFTEHLGSIKSSYENYICDYEKSMVVCDDVCFPYESCFVETEKTLPLCDWIWCRKDNGDEFSFDSEAEKNWAFVLNDIRTNSIETAERKETELFADSRFLWGKNFPSNSEIKYEYYLEGIHSSYPDFLMKDRNGQIHVFEVKSVNKSSSVKIDEEEYKQKVKALKDCYKEASKKTGHIFYLPILENSQWKITRFINGVEDTITKNTFIDSLKNNTVYSMSPDKGLLNVAID